jgi:hypothetical protein
MPKQKETEPTRIPSALSAEGRFSKYGPEEEIASRIAEIRDSEPVRKLVGAWRAHKYTISTRSGNFDYAYQSYERALELIRDLDYTSEDVENFSLVLGEHQHEANFKEKAGMFLSALINNGQDDDYVVHTKHFKEDLDHFGYKNKKNITVNGPVGVYCFANMVSGRVVVEGNAEYITAQEMEGGELIIKGNAARLGIFMKGGKITVEGNGSGLLGWTMEGGEIIAKGDSYSPGPEMRGGKITVYGDAGVEVGRYMKGGEIHLEGEYESIGGDRKGGKIFYKGEQIAGEGIDEQVDQ